MNGFDEYQITNANHSKKHLPLNFKCHSFFIEFFPTSYHLLFSKKLFSRDKYITKSGINQYFGKQTN